MSNDIIWSDFDSDLSKTNNNNIAMLKNINSVKNAVKNILNTPRGADLMDPYFGTNIYDFIFEQLDDINLNLISDMVRNDLNNQESRIMVKTVKITKTSDNSINILVIFTLKDSNIEESILFNAQLGN
jgi:phage baseplate assembly protein W